MATLGQTACLKFLFVVITVLPIQSCLDGDVLATPLRPNKYIADLDAPLAFSSATSSATASFSSSAFLIAKISSEIFLQNKLTLSFGGSSKLMYEIIYSAALRSKS